MSLDEWRIVFASACIILIISVFAPFFNDYLPNREEHFFALAVLGEEGRAEQYYPDDDPNIELDEEIRWTLYLHNHMGEAQYVALRVKLLNSTMRAPNTTTCSQSPVPVIYEARRILLENETLYHSFNWSLLSVNRNGNLTTIEGLMINGEPFQTNVSAKNISNFRLIIELWTYNTAFKDFIFGWNSNENSRCAWNQIWINVS